MHRLVFLAVIPSTVEYNNCFSIVLGTTLSLVMTSNTWKGVYRFYTRATLDRHGDTHLNSITQKPEAGRMLV